MHFISCSIPEQFVNPLFEVFDGGDLILSSYRDVEEPLTKMRIFFVDPSEEDAARQSLGAAMDIVGVKAEIESGELPDEDWKLAYRRHFKIEEIGRRLVTVPAWEKVPEGDRLPIVLDPGMAFGTGKHETTRACLEYIDELADTGLSSFIDMGCGSGILSIAAAKLGYGPVCGFDVDQEAVDASIENAEKNGVSVAFEKFALGRASKAGSRKAGGDDRVYDLVAANILGPLLIRFADEIVGYVGKKIIISGILTELYPEVLAAFASRGFSEVSKRTIGEWTTGLLTR